MNIVKLADRPGARISHDRAEAKDTCQQLIHGLGDQIFGFMFGLLIGVKIAAPMMDGALEKMAGSFAHYVSRTYKSKLFQSRRE